MNRVLKLVVTAFDGLLGRASIGKTLLLSILFFSSLITILLTGIQLFIDYNVEINNMNARLNEIERSYKNSIEASLWDVDRDQLDIQLEGIKRLPDIEFVNVRERQDVGSAIFIVKGESTGLSVKKTYDLNHFDGEETFSIGTLEVESSLTAVYQRLFNKALTIMLVQGVKTFLVSFFILFVFYRLVTRHIISIEKFLLNTNLRDSFSALELSRKPSKKSDELDHLVSAYNSMITDLRRSYDDLRTVNVQLKKDIVARKQAQADVKLLNDELENRVVLRTSELEAANKELNSFCYSVSHDLRAPLRRVEGFRRNFTEQFASKFDPQGMHYLSRMEACTSEMNAMIDSFLILSKSTSAELLIEEVDLSGIVERIIARLCESDESREVAVTIQKNMLASCDARLAGLLLTNLLENAWKYSSKNPEAAISFFRKKKKGEYIYIIEDNGVGFDMAFAGNLFSPFTRLHKLSDFQGVGVGLATVKRVAARHGGRVWAESAVNEGAKFHFTLRPPKFSIEENKTPDTTAC
ncbi:MAG: signal transduction histidine kinase [Candidatus Endobugula sp.]|jgi:signal transduction histidine kinase